MGPQLSPRVDTAAAGRSDIILDVRNLSTVFDTLSGQVRAVNSVDVTVRRGRTVGIVGETGCGKSVTLRSILGLVRRPGRITQGEVIFQGSDMLKLRERERRRMRGSRIGFIAQQPWAALNPVLTIGKQFENVLRAHGAYEGHASATDRIVAILRAVELREPEALLERHAFELSGGMAQRVVIALALLLDPDLVVADEPTTALDLTVQRQILDLIDDLVVRSGRSMLMVTHDLGVVAHYCHDVVVMYAGKVVESGPVDRVFGQPAHPYTQALLAAIPRPGRVPAHLDGALPDLIDYPRGCPFGSRCTHVFDRCVGDAPQLRDIGHGQHVSCHLDVEHT